MPSTIIIEGPNGPEERIVLTRREARQEQARKGNLNLQTTERVGTAGASAFKEPAFSANLGISSGNRFTSGNLGPDSTAALLIGGLPGALGAQGLGGNPLSIRRPRNLRR